MNEFQFKEVLDKLAATNSRNEKQEIIEQVSDEPAAISFLSGSEFDSAGLGKKTVLSVAQDVYGDSVDGKPTVSESLEAEDRAVTEGMPLNMLREDMEKLSELGGNDMKQKLSNMFDFYEYPSVVAHACLDDYPTGVGDSTIADAMGVRDSLPFYDGVHEIAADEEPRVEPEVGEPLKPMLAAPESRGEPANSVSQVKVDGYRAILHISDTNGLTGDENRVTVFSRRMNEISESVPELTEEMDFPAGSYILDGEIIAENGSYSDTSSRIGTKKDNIERDVEMEYKCFDTIIYAGEKVWTEPYSKRYTRLESFDINTSDTFEVLPIETDIEAALDQAAAHDDEGIIVKDWQAPYKFDKRSEHWQKRKLDAETIDLKIAGFHEGEGALDGTLGKVELRTSDGVYVGDSGSGFSEEERDEIWNNQDEWFNKCVEIEARGLGTGGDTGQPKLRMPIFVRDRNGDGSPDSWERVQEIMKEV